ncbi:hypothetical protein SAMN05421676_107159 [Salinibacillus kushneri]|uniref:Uncharacterized protein n=1 Tax=Salinibacillus kushneri TaxID=237682 RepID=A0A1I0GW36_9BACI|nr:DUF4179 domain-containing protein [Salinibacillus kushneri]SET74519.1 hypothetical protein SAMN05421676_107159 [Salinibacillus kushneri]
MCAFQNDHYQEMGASREHNGVTMTLDGVIADQKGFVLFMLKDKEETEHPSSTHLFFKMYG